MESKFCATMNDMKKDDNFKMTSEEIGNLKEAFKKEEFRKMFAEYLNDMQDPKYRAEQEAYIRQCEERNQVPEGVDLIHPEPGFVVKTREVSSSKDKFFINVCSHERIGKPTSREVVTKEGKKGRDWSLPHSVGPKHMEKDKSGNLCATYDVCFHPDAVKRCFLDERWKQFVAETSIGGVEKRAKKDGSARGSGEVKLNREHHILRNVRCLGSSTTLSSMNLGSSKHQKKKIVKEKKSTLKKGFLSSSSSSSSSSYDVKEAPKNHSVPKFAVIHQQRVCLSNYMHDDAPTETKIKKNELSGFKIKIELPKLRSARKIDLDVSDKRLVLHAEGTYHLDFAFPREVIGDKGSAKFDKKSHTLIVTVPVRPREEEKVKKIDLVNKKHDDNDDPSSNVVTLVESKDEKKKKSSSSSTKQLHDRWIRVKNLEEEEKSKQFAQEIRERAAKALSEAKIHEKEEEEEEVKKKDKEKAKNIPTPSSSLPPKKKKSVRFEEEKKEEEEETEVDFIPSKSFKGSRKNFVFFNGDRGLGYYRDQGVYASSTTPSSCSSSMPTTTTKTTTTNNTTSKTPLPTIANDGNETTKLPFKNSLMWELD